MTDEGNVQDLYVVADDKKGGKVRMNVAESTGRLECGPQGAKFWRDVTRPKPGAATAANA